MGYLWDIYGINPKYNSKFFKKMKWWIFFHLQISFMCGNEKKLQQKNRKIFFHLQIYFMCENEKKAPTKE